LVHFLKSKEKMHQHENLRQIYSPLWHHHIA
jgi:hypothetical protein